MKKIEATIKPFKLEAVKDELAELGITEIAIIETRKSGPQNARIEIFRGRKFTVDFLPMIKLEILTDDHRLDAAIAAILKSAEIKKSGDGEEIVTAIEQYVSLRKSKELEPAV